MGRQHHASQTQSPPPSLLLLNSIPPTRHPPAVPPGCHCLRLKTSAGRQAGRQAGRHFFRDGPFTMPAVCQADSESPAVQAQRTRAESQSNRLRAIIIMSGPRNGKPGNPLSLSPLTAALRGALPALPFYSQRPARQAPWPVRLTRGPFLSARLISPRPVSDSRSEPSPDSERACLTCIAPFAPKRSRPAGGRPVARAQTTRGDGAAGPFRPRAGASLLRVLSTARAALDDSRPA